MSGAVPLTATRRNLPKRQRAVARSHTCCTLRRKPPEKRSGCSLAMHDHQLVVLEQVAVGVEHAPRRRRPRSTSRLVVELEQRQPAALAVDDAQVADDAGQQLRLARVDQFVDLALGRSAAPRARPRRTGGPTGRSRSPSSRSVSRSFTPQGVASTSAGSCVLAACESPSVEQAALVGVGLGRRRRNRRRGRSRRPATRG